MKRVVLESPFASPDPRQRAKYLRYARKALKDALSRGETPFVSHLLYTQPGVLNDQIEEEREKGIAAGNAWLESCEYVVVYMDYGISPGMLLRLTEALKLALPITYRKINR